MHSRSVKFTVLKSYPGLLLCLALWISSCGVSTPPPSPQDEGSDPRGDWFARRPWPINFHFKEPLERRGAVCEAAAAWNRMAEQPFFICDPNTGDAPGAPNSLSQQLRYESDGLNSVAFNSIWAFTKKDFETPAFTTLVTANGVLVEADIYFNNLRYLWADRSRQEGGPAGTWDVRSVSLHELGHWIFGPGHIPSSEDPESVMRSHLKEQTIHAEPSRGDGERLRKRLSEAT